MTKSQTFYYVAVVIIITFLAYLYTTVVNAPESNMEEQDVVVTENPVTTEEIVEVESESDATPPEPVTLPNTSWRFDYTEGTDQSLVLTPKKPGAFILTFDEAGKMSSETDCNALGGSYTLSGTSLTFGSLMSTKMFCEDSDEAAYSAQLSQVESVDLSVNTIMRLNLKGGAGVMIFSKATEAIELPVLEEAVPEMSL